MLNAADHRQLAAIISNWKIICPRNFTILNRTKLSKCIEKLAKPIQNWQNILEVSKLRNDSSKCAKVMWVYFIVPIKNKSPKNVLLFKKPMIKKCQKEIIRIKIIILLILINFHLLQPYYGAHFYRVHKMKPKRGQQPFFADLRLVAVMPSGIGICREERGGTRRLFTSLHEWHQIRTLQFDRKRFLLGTVENGIAVDHVFYTDLHSKSAYLVRFAASQHR